MDFTELESKTGAIPIFEKILLSTDGSITALLELFLEDKIEIKHVNKDEKIDLNQNRIKREVTIETSSEPLIHAISVIHTKNTPPDLMHALAFDDTPIGKILSKNNIESRRVIKEIACRDNDLKQYFNTNLPLLFRRYDIIHNGNAVIEITESFPIRSIAKKVSLYDTITKARNQLDVINQEIVMQLIKRMEIAKIIGQIKKTDQKNIESKKREETILKRIYEIGSELDRDFLTKIFNLIFSESKRIQSEV